MMWIAIDSLLCILDCPEDIPAPEEDAVGDEGADLKDAQSLMTEAIDVY